MKENSYEEHDEGFSLCNKMRDRIPDLFEGALDALTGEAIRAHLAACFFCSRIYGEMERTIHLVEHMPMADPLKDFGPSIMNAIYAKDSNPIKRAWSKLRPRRE